MKTVLYNIGELTISHSERPLVGKEFSERKILTNACLVWENGKIIEHGDSNSLKDKYKNETLVDAGGKAVLPGFIDSHTHLVFSGSRHEEYEAKIQGKSYSELHKSGGILYTVEKTREASEEELYEQAKSYLDLMLLHGTTTVEAKTGYGLNEENELKIAKVMKKLKNSSVQDLFLTYLGAHTIPKEFKERPDEYLKIVKKLIPEMAKTCDFIDIWCDRLGFNLEQTEELAKLGQDAGLKVKLHVEQTGENGGGALAAKVKAISCDHLDCISEQSMEDLAKTNTIGVLLPSVTYHLMEFSKNIPVSKMKDKNLKLALASDFNPGSCPSLSMQRVMEDACRLYKFNYAEAIHGSTLNAAFALDTADRIGSFAPGKLADIVVLDVDSADKMIHQFGRNHVLQVFKNGEQVVKDGQLL